jgi:hypothetical protein
MHARTLLLCLLSLAIASPALAQPYGGGGYGAPVRTERHGLFGGGGLYGGEISCEGNCGESFRSAAGANGHLGYKFSHQLALIFDLWAMTSSQNDVEITYVMASGGVRLWLAPQFWVQGTIGSGHANVRVGNLEARGDDVPIGQLAVGFELVKGYSWTIDLQARIAQGSSTDDFGNNVSTGRAAGIGAAITFYQRRPRQPSAPPPGYGPSGPPPSGPPGPPPSGPPPGQY